jgi:CRP-like cAMP-binding protein
MRLSQQEVKWLSGVLRKMDFFSLCTLGEIEDFVGIATRKHYDKGKGIIKQGEYGSFFFVINKGRVSVWAQESGTGKRKIASLGPGEYFGETALVEKKPRNSTVIADGPCEMFLFYSGDFIDLMTSNPSLEQRFHKVAVKRSAERDYKLTQPKQGFFKKLFGIK